MGVHPFLHSYVLSHLYDPTPPAPEQRAARAACLSLAHKVPAGPLDGGFVLAFTATLAKTNQTPVKDLVEKWLRQSPTTASSTRELLKSLVLALQHTNEAEELRKLSHILSSACVVPSLASQTVDALKAGTIVDVLHRIYTNHSNPSTHLDTRFNLLFASNTLLLAAFPPSKLDPDHTLDDLLEALTPAMEDASTTDPKNTSWLADLEAQFEYIDQLEREVSQDCKADARFDYLGQILRSFRATTKLTDLMNSKTKVGPEAGPSTVQSHQSNARDSAALDAAMDQIASILGDTSLSPDLIRSNLSHPRFLSNGSYNVECFVSAYFDGTLPDTSLEGNDTAIADQTTKPEQVLHERTAFDQMWDESKMRSGKKDLRQQEKISEDVKKSILALAEHDSDEEEEEDIEEHRRDGLRLVSMEDWEDEEAGPPAFRDKGAESASSSDEEEGSAPRPSGIATPNDPFTPAVVAVLSEAYIEHGLDVLLRPNKTTKPTPQRVALVQRLQGAGWDGGEDLIQSWGRMLDRDPKKQRRLEPYQFSGNRPDSTTVPPQASGSGSGRRGGGGGGGGNRGSGRGRGGRGMNRGKAARARGHDRKFRGAFGT